jgi:16S rRNA U516 pseudouridylate synthase RsuA-like enzyme
LLLVTNDGDLCYLLNSEGRCTKEYIVVVNRLVTEEKLEALRKGVQLTEGFARARSVDLLSQTIRKIEIKERIKQDKKRRKKQKGGNGGMGGGAGGAAAGQRSCAGTAAEAEEILVGGEGLRLVGGVDTVASTSATAGATIDNDGDTGDVMVADDGDDNAPSASEQATVRTASQVRAVLRVEVDVGYTHVIKRLVDAVGLSVMELHRYQ